ncbi:MAG: V-type ATP synthase subunit D [Dehalococcoidales bacterium]|jgi:V/A-type H+-transporting ATPase subunit D|nr:V-type ATP synthase subunit D [Dehalococcoidales bacterium]
MTQQSTRRLTKIELIRMRKRLTLASKIRRILKDRLSILVMEFLQIARETVEARQNLNDHFKDAFTSLSITSGYHGYIALGKEISGAEKELEIVSGTRNIAGTKVPLLEMKDTGTKKDGYSQVDTSSYLDRTSQLAEKCLDSLVTLSELQSTLEILGKEISRTKRIVNALEYMVIPNLEKTIRFLRMKFEERDREEKARLKQVKLLLEKRDSHD